MSSLRTMDEYVYDAENNARSDPNTAQVAAQLAIVVALREVAKKIDDLIEYKWTGKR